MFQSAPESGRERKREGRRRGREKEGGEKREKRGKSHRIFRLGGQTAKPSLKMPPCFAIAFWARKEEEKKGKEKRRRREKREGGRGKRRREGLKLLQKFRGLRPRTPLFPGGGVNHSKMDLLAQKWSLQWYCL